jgi:hypothetical protein
MNELIRQLADQCRFERQGINCEVLDQGFDEEKFAQLIVRECIGICKYQEYKYWRSSEEDHWTPIDSANAIEEHFGLDK